ncbi:FHA domain-containing protein [Uliginosibacterium gangwonense]|uniref:FHA domain-containing protein n=1 Tax=Uliginosibacterium gangwonense TaxID=392736 RepID=UPI00036CE67B|nr:FHA domain-containing protein [Uliginosibacterium gangwonense]
MTEGYIIEFASRAGEFLFRQSLGELPATVGRALNNDFIVDDPYVAAQHLRLEIAPEADGAILVTDLGSRNGLQKDGKRVAQIRLCCGETISFGHTTLRLRHVQEQVAPERIDLFASRMFSQPVAILLFTLSVATALADVPFSHLEAISATIWLGGALGFGALLLGWAAFWSILGRIFAGRAQFIAHLAIAGWSYLSIYWGSLLCTLAAFSLSWALLAQGSKVLMGVVGIWALHRHLSLAQMRWPRLNFPLAVALLALPTTFLALNTWKSEHRLLDTDTLDTLYDPALRIRGDQSLDQFMSEMPALRERADAQRKPADEEDDASEDTSNDE